MVDDNRIQETISSKLESSGFYPFSVIYTTADNPFSIGGFLAITMYFKNDYDRLLKFIDYDNMCDVSGLFLIPDHLTVYIYGLSLINFLSSI